MNATKNIVRQMEPKVETIEGNTFYIYPFGAMKSANLSGEIIALMMPIIASMAPALGKDKKVMDIDANEVAPYIGSAFSSLSGDKVEDILRKLLLEGNIGVLKAGGSDAEWLNEDISNELFCGNAQNMFILAFYVIKVNYSGFFEKLGNLSGNAAIQAAMKKTGYPGMAPLT